MGYCTDNQYEYFMRNVVDWEKQMVENDTILIKFYLSISIDTQATRFEIRRNHDLKYWKLSQNDLKSVEHWESYTTYKEKMFEKTGWDKAPWLVINADNKLVAQLNIFDIYSKELITQTRKIWNREFGMQMKQTEV